MIPGTSTGLAAVKICWERYFEVAAEIDMSNTTKARKIIQRQSEPIDTSKPTPGHYTALQGDEIQFHQPEYRNKLSQPGKYHRTLIQPHPWGQTPQPRRTMTLKTFFSYKSHFIPPTYFYLHISLLQCSGVFLFVFPVQKKIILRFLSFFSPLFVIFLILFLIYSTDFLIFLYQL